MSSTDNTDLEAVYGMDVITCKDKCIGIMITIQLDSEF